MSYDDSAKDSEWYDLKFPCTNMTWSIYQRTTCPSLLTINISLFSGTSKRTKSQLSISMECCINIYCLNFIAHQNVLPTIWYMVMYFLMSQIFIQALHYLFTGNAQCLDMCFLLAYWENAPGQLTMPSSELKCASCVLWAIKSWLYSDPGRCS